MSLSDLFSLLAIVGTMTWFGVRLGRLLQSILHEQRALRKYVMRLDTRVVSLEEHRERKRPQPSGSTHHPAPPAAPPFGLQQFPQLGG